MKRISGRILAGGFVLLSLAMLAVAQAKVVPIVSLMPENTDDGPQVNYGNLLGGVENGRWLDAKTTYGKLKGNSKFSLFNFESGTKNESSLGEIKPGPDACPENYYVSPELKSAAEFAVGTNANWKIVPRPSRAVDPADAGYKKAVADFLKLRGVAKSPANIKQAFRVDLDGDGSEEVVIAAAHSVGDETEGPKAGSYSVVLIRKTVAGKAQTLLADGNFVKRSDDYFDGERRVSGLADLNGDGRMEIIVDISGYEENWTKVFEIKTGKPVEVKALAYYCGV